MAVATLDGNVTIESGRRFPRVFVAGTKIERAVSVEIVQRMKERVDPQGWRIIEPEGESELVIRIPMRFVKMREEKSA